MENEDEKQMPDSDFDTNSVDNLNEDVDWEHFLKQ